MIVYYTRNLSILKYSCFYISQYVLKCTVSLKPMIWDKCLYALVRSPWRIYFQQRESDAQWQRICSALRQASNSKTSLLVQNVSNVIHNLLITGGPLASGKKLLHYVSSLIIDWSLARFCSVWSRWFILLADGVFRLQQGGTRLAELSAEWSHSRAGQRWICVGIHHNNDGW